MLAVQNPFADAAWWVAFGGILLVAYVVAAVSGRSEQVALIAALVVWLGLSAVLALLPEIW